MRCPTGPAEYAVGRDNIGETGNEIEPKNERDNVAGGFGAVAEQCSAGDNDSDNAEACRKKSCRERPARASRCRFTHLSDSGRSVERNCLWQLTQLSARRPNALADPVMSLAAARLVRS